MIITNANLIYIYPLSSGRNRAKYLPYFNKYLSDYDITTIPRICAYFAQIGHESGQLNYSEEIYSGERYDVGKLAERLGNTSEDDNDGEKYKGRGLIQITGRTNYQLLSKTYHIDFLAHPELLATPEWAVKSSMWFWEYNNLNKIADSGDFQKLTKAINGGLNGYKDRLEIYDRCKKCFV